MTTRLYDLNTYCSGLANARQADTLHAIGLFDSLTRPPDFACLTFILRGELPHLCREALVELVLSGDERLANSLFPKS